MPSSSQAARAAAASITGTARGRMQGSWRPVTERTASSPVDRSTVSWGLEMEGVGRMVTWNSTGMPLVMPPLTPPERLVRALTCPPSM